MIDHNDPSADNPIGDEDDSDFEDVQPILPDPIYDLALIKTLANGQSASVQEGDQIDYQITITNQGNVPSNSYTVIDQMPTGMSFVSASDFGALANGVVTWTDLSNLDPGDTRVLTIILRMEDVTLSSYRNIAEISEDSASDFGLTDEDSTPDDNPTNDPAIDHNDPSADNPVGDEDDNDFEDISPIVPAPIYDLALIKTLAPSQASVIEEGDLVTYNITVTNQGNVPSNDYSVMDQIPVGMSYSSSSDGGSHANGLVTWSSLPNLDPGDSRVLLITLRLDDATQDSYRNIAEITDDSAEDYGCLLYTSPSPRDATLSRMPSSA